MALFYNFLKPVMWVSSVSFLFLFDGMAILQKAHLCAILRTTKRPSLHIVGENRVVPPAPLTDFLHSIGIPHPTWL